MVHCIRDKPAAGRFLAAGIYATAILVLLAGCSTGRDELVLEQQYRGYIQPSNGREQVPLPEGGWRLAAWKNYADEIGGVLIQTRGRQISAVIDFHVPYDTGRRLGSKPPYQFCGRVDILHVGKSFTGACGVSPCGRGKVMQDCWGIDHMPVGFYGDVPKHLIEFRDYAEARGLELPSTLIAARYRRSGGSRGPGGFRGFMSVDYYFNPEIDGFLPSREIDWRTSEWHRDRAIRDPQKKAYIEKLIRWAESWHDQVDKGYRGLLKRGGA